MSQLTSPPTHPTIAGTEADSNPATAPRAEVSRPGQLYFSLPIAGPTGSTAVTAPRRPAPPTGPTMPWTDADSNPATTSCALVSGPGQLYFSVPIAGLTRSATVTARVAWPRWPVMDLANPN
jgi:hypothetical protein